FQNRESAPANLPSGEVPKVKTPAEPAPASKIPRSHPPRRATTFKPATSLEDTGTETVNREAAGRRIVGVLVTYTWKPEGQLFALREGRNLIGRDPDQCEIAVPDDSALSARNTIISY